MILRRLLPLVTVVLWVLASATHSHAVAIRQGPNLLPHQWPQSEGVSPQIQGWANSLRIWGEDRYQTSLAVSLTMRGAGGFPYETADNSSVGSIGLGNANGWWGLDSCPRAIILVAGDSPADAFVATTLTDPTGLGNEPYLRRVAAADPLFDPIGGFKRVDTDRAPILVTESTRQGARALTTATRLAAQDLRTGGCRTARDAIIVGGPSAIPASVETELLTMGYAEVFRVWGDNRYETAASVANALGTDALPAGTDKCADFDGTDSNSRMGFYSNAAVEWRPSNDECRLLGRTVVLTDGVTGADAFAAGWWTSFWRVPVLLHNGGTVLPEATATALQTAAIENVIVLGGEARISNEIAEEAALLSGAEMVRVGGSDRYETSVAMAKFFGGWWPTGKAVDYVGSMVCLAGSRGNGKRASGWPDAIAAASWCALASGAAANPGAPGRALRMLKGDSPSVVPPSISPRREAVPILLVEPGVVELPPVVEQFLNNVFPAEDSWCASIVRSGGCSFPGFAIGFGGPDVIADEIMARVSKIVGGRLYLNEVSQPIMREPFITALVTTPIFHQTTLSSMKACVSRANYEGARWLVAGVDNQPNPQTVVDVFLAEWYLADYDGTARTATTGAPGCFALSTFGSESEVWMRSSGLSGLVSGDYRFGIQPEDRVTLNRSLLGAADSYLSGPDMSVIEAGLGTTTALYKGAGNPVFVEVSGQALEVARWEMVLSLNRGEAGAINPAHNFIASFKLHTMSGSVLGTASGEAVSSGTNWFLRGRTELSEEGLRNARGVGGFELDLAAGGFGAQDDTISMNFDAFKVISFPK